MSGKQWRQNADRQYICDGDCTSWDIGICTCGLVHHLKYFNSLRGRQYEDGHTQKFRRRHYDSIQFLKEHRIESETTCRHGVDLDEECQKCKQEVDDLLEEFGT